MAFVRQAVQLRQTPGRPTHSVLASGGLVVEILAGELSCGCWSCSQPWDETPTHNLDGPPIHTQDARLTKDTGPRARGLPPVVNTLRRSPRTRCLRPLPPSTEVEHSQDHRRRQTRPTLLLHNPPPRRRPPRPDPIPSRRSRRGRRGLRGLLPRHPLQARLPAPDHHGDPARRGDRPRLQARRDRRGPRGGRRPGRLVGRAHPLGQRGGRGRRRARRRPAVRPRRAHHGPRRAGGAGEARHCGGARRGAVRRGAQAPAGRPAVSELPRAVRAEQDCKHGGGCGEGWGGDVDTEGRLAERMGYVEGSREGGGQAAAAKRGGWRDLGERGGGRGGWPVRARPQA